MKLNKNAELAAGASFTQNSVNDVLTELVPIALNMTNRAKLIASENISVIKFEGQQVRIIKINNEPWFVLKDIALALEISDHIVAARRLDKDEKGKCLIPTLGGDQITVLVAESGFYKLIARSRKSCKAGTCAHRFTNWVFRDVIPSIRKTGAYGVPWPALNDFSRRDMESKAKGSQAGRELAQRRYEKERLNREEAQLWQKYQPDLLGGNHA